MKKLSLVALGLIMMVMFSVSASAQGTAAAPLKVGLIDTGAFADEKEGIKRYYNALIALEKEVTPKRQELVTLQTRIQTIAQDIQKLQNPPAGVPQNQADVANQIRAKQEEGSRLQRELEFKNKEFEAFVDKRSGEVLGPLNQDIGRAISDYGKQKGFAMIFDIDKLAQSGVILAADPTANITTDFITFYNARPAAAATASNQR
ncbi:MAG: OmpH family outer membrane protein [Acidobacteria bacterium]|nr:OmpH family outer membrane protein [Acidobacteriota bacterium]